MRLHGYGVLFLGALLGNAAMAGQGDLSPALWPAAERKYYEDILDHTPTVTGVVLDQPMAVGTHGAVAGAYGAPAIRAGLEALKQGGTSADAALTTTLAQIVFANGLAVSYTGILSMVHYEAATGKVYSLNATYNTVRGEAEPLKIPASDVYGGLAGHKVKAVENGRQMLVPGYLKGVEAAHKRFGKLPFASLFEPAIWYADNGFRLSEYEADFIDKRVDALMRLDGGRHKFLKADGKPYSVGDVFKQPDVADFLRHVAKQGADYVYRGPFAEKMVKAVQADGGKLTLDDLAAYDVIWQEPVRGTFRDYEILGNGLPAQGGVNTQEALNVYEASGLREKGPYTKSGETLFWMTQISELINLSFLPPDAAAAVTRSMGISADPAQRLSKAQAEQVWHLMTEKKVRFLSSVTNDTHHSDVVVATDRWGNITAIVQSINSLGDVGLWVEGVSLNNAGGFQQQAIAAVGPGKRLPDPTTPMLILKKGKPVAAAGSMSPGLHQKTFQSLVNLLDYGMTPKAAIDAPYFMYPRYAPKPGVDLSKPQDIEPGDLQPIYRVVKGSFDPAVLADARKRGVGIEEVPLTQTREAQGLFIVIDRDPKTGAWRAAAPNVTNGTAVAY
jgi:gamma-glutamyltranspeptidase/glutathione hydrolase